MSKLIFFECTKVLNILFLNTNTIYCIQKVFICSWKYLFIIELKNTWNSLKVLKCPAFIYLHLFTLCSCSLGVDFLGRGCDKALFSEKKGFSVRRGEAFCEWGVWTVWLGFLQVRQFLNSAKRSGPFSEPPDSEKWKVAVLIPFWKITLLFCFPGYPCLVACFAAALR